MPVEAALAQVLANVRGDVRVEIQVDLINALACVLAVDIISPLAVPGDDNSAMDGYALRAADATGPLPVSQRIPAGTVGAPLQPGTAARIFTGASIPEGADAVVMQENCTVENGSVTVSGSVKVGQNIRPRGQDIAQGQVVLSAGRRLRPQDLGLLASIGAAQVTVFRPLKVAILSTGDELVDPASGTHLQPGQLYNSNRYTLAGLLSSLNMEVVDAGIIPDDPEATALALQGAADSADCVISSGGVSVGEEDHVKNQVEKLGSLNLWKLAIKPGKPLAFGAIGNTPFFGLPGNPTSVYVTFCLVARPFLLKMQGLDEPEAVKLMAVAAFNSGKPGGRQEYRRVTVGNNAAGGLETMDYGNQSSGVLSSVSHSNALAVIPPGSVINEGDLVEVILLDQFA
ncbi:MAG: molybdopterin molybdotransferase MoeA [Proteobacteria bacterium]|nr:molybdopterin molybdotransferase MoeA [Pseudomonadota bacterium]